MLTHDTTLRRPRTLFTIALLTLGLTILLTYERITSSSTLSLFHWPSSHPIDLTLTDEERAQHAIFDAIGPMSYGTAHRPPMKGLPKHLVADLPDELVPGVGAGHVERLIIIGDVHGHKRALEDLLEKLHFDTKTDSLVLTGDLINKGPDSAGVVALAMKLGAHSVRGNHEDRILLVHHAITAADEADADSSNADSTEPPDEPPTAALETLQIRDDTSQHESQQDLEAARKEYLDAERHLSKGDKRAREIARSLSHKQTKWLSELPLILRIGAVPRNAKHPAFAHMLVVHAGLVPRVALADQDPWAVMNMRTISHPIDELRRDAVENFLREKAKRLPGGKVAALQAVDGMLVDAELGKILAAQGLGGEEEEEEGAGAVALPSSGREGTYWYEEWSKHQERLVKEAKKEDKKDKHRKGGTGREKHRDEEPITTVVYGHDAKSGLRVPKELGKGKKGYTFGLDSGCVYGGKLSALVVKVEDGQAVHEFVQVDCA